MNHRSQRGVVLVITLLMLSVVTLMAVVFLAMSRREKASVNVTSDQTGARLMADAAVARAQAEIAVWILASTNPFNYDLIVSTNYINANGFRPNVSSPTNVSYTLASGQPLTSLNDQLQNLANLQYDARAPVFIPTNNAGATDFRFYLDFNRNGRFETNGWLPVLGDRPGQFFRTNGTPVNGFEGNSVLFQNFVGDPEWIGILERPDRPHSESNRFVGRYAFIVLPAGKSLDFNYVHNNAKQLNANLQADGFNRNQGVGSWELNLAAFLRDLNTNAWRNYRFVNTAFAPSTGETFDDARAILARRYFDVYKPNQKYLLASVRDLFGAPGATAFQSSSIDGYSDGPLVNSPLRPWSGSPNPELYYDVQELFNPALTSPLFVQRLLGPTTNSLSSYDRYTFYRLLAQLGTDSRPAESNQVYASDFRLHWTNKLHLNYRNDVPNGQTNFIPWDPNTPGNRPAFPNQQVFDAVAARNPIDFFYQAADRALHSSLVTNVVTNLPPRQATFYLLGNRPVRPTICLTNIQIYHIPTNGYPFYSTNNEYTAALHQKLQVAANVYDAATSRRIKLAGLNGEADFPSVFRPTFYKSATNIIINGFVEETGTNFLSLPWRSVEEISSSPFVGQLNVNIYGVPLVIGAKKGYPNFNEVTMQTVAQVSRKLEVRRPGVNSLPTQTNQMYVLGISNLFGVEGWNSYTQDFRRDFELRVTNQYTIGLSHVIGNTTNQVGLMGASGRLRGLVVTNHWPGRSSQNSFLLPAQTNFVFLPDMVYSSLAGRFVTNNIFENTTRVPQWVLNITNRLQYILIDRSAGRIIDFVNLDRLVSQINVTQRLMGNTNAAGGGIFGDRQLGAISDDQLWNTNRIAANLNAPSYGVTNQIGVSLGIPLVGEGTWRSATGDPISGRDKEKAIDEFANFLRGRSTNLVMQAPFSPTRKIFDRRSWQVNDPLVHYTVEDLTDPTLTQNNFGIIRPASTPVPASNLGLMNERYRPWGGNPNKSSTDNTSFNMTLKDPGVRSSDDWEFPTNKFANVGWLGRVHRGTPWQTIFLKGLTNADLKAWTEWSGSIGTHPINDRKLIDLFTVAPNANASRGLLAVNQSNLAAWSAVLSGVSVLSNSMANPGPVTGMKFDEHWVAPNSAQLKQIVDGINRARARMPGARFQTVGDVLSAPELTELSPFLNINPRQIERGLTDAAVERIPQQILSLLKTDEPRIVVYAFGQSLKPAERSLVTAGNFYNICTNYQITGEHVLKAVLRLEDAPQKPRVVVESYHLLPPE